jgi:WD40 repeat protein
MGSLAKHLSLPCIPCRLAVIGVGSILLVAAAAQPPATDTLTRKESAACSPDGKRLLTAEAINRPGLFRVDEDGKLLPDSRSLFVWEADTGKLLKKIDVDLGTNEFKYRTDWRVGWLNDDIVLLQLFSRKNSFRPLADVVLALLDWKAGKIVKTATLNCGEDVLLSPHKKWALSGDSFHFARQMDGRLVRRGFGASSGVDLTDLATFQIVAKLHQGGPNRVIHRAWSPDSRWAATVTIDNAIHLWNVDKRKCIGTLKGHTATILSITFAPDNRTLLTASEDGTARLWETSTGKLRVTLIGHLAGLNDAIFDGNGGRILTGAEDETARLWDATSGQLLRTFADHESGVHQVAFADGGKSIVTITAEGIQRIWSVADGSQLAGLPGAIPRPTQTTGRRPRQTIRVLPALGVAALAPNGSSVATSGAGLLGVWDLTKWDKVTGQGRKPLTGHTGKVAGLEFAGDSNALVVGLADGFVSLWDVVNDNQLNTFPAHGDGLRSLSFGRDGKWLATVGNDSVVALWDVRTGKLQWRLNEGVGTADTVALSPNGQLLASAGLSNRKIGSATPSQVKLWHAATGKLAHTLGDLDSAVVRLAFSPDGKLIAAACCDGTIRLWEAATGKLSQVLNDNVDIDCCLAFSPNGKLLATGHVLPGRIHLWDVARGELLVNFIAHGNGTVSVVGFTPDGQTLVSIGSVNAIKLWQVDKLLQQPVR